ncbi:MAG: SOS response-associated peptidase [Bacteroidales bacterium]|nr:SOS response-associated peptidase [Bacteroidales bacterium]
MCFSVNVNLVKEELEERYGISFPDKYRYQPSYYYHAFSLPEIPAICSGNPDSIRLLKWGLIPLWVRNVEEGEAIRLKTFNARSESIETKPSFSGSFKSKRCVIPVKGFFEWQHVGKEKIPWYIYRIDNEIISIAGLYSEWTDLTSGEMISTFSIITTDANDLMAVVHNSKKRMPAILDVSEERRWLDLTAAKSDVLNLLRPCPSDVLKAHTISPLVNDRTADRNTSEVIRPFDYNTGNLLL